jgi:hypothetical protein
MGSTMSIKYHITSAIFMMREECHGVRDEWHNSQLFNLNNYATTLLTKIGFILLLLVFSGKKRALLTKLRVIIVSNQV